MRELALHLLQDAIIQFTDDILQGYHRLRTIDIKNRCERPNRVSAKTRYLYTYWSTLQLGS